MEVNMAIVLGNDGIDFEYSKLCKHIYGSICIETDSFCFPGKQWTDFVYPIMDWWSNEFIKAYRCRKKMKLLFMDGSFVVFGNINGTTLTLECCDDPVDNGNKFYKFDLPIKVFKDDLINALTLCQNIFLSNDDKKMSDKCYSQIISLSNLQL